MNCGWRCWVLLIIIISMIILGICECNAETCPGTSYIGTGISEEIIPFVKLEAVHPVHYFLSQVFVYFSFPTAILNFEGEGGIGASFGIGHGDEIKVGIEVGTYAIIGNGNDKDYRNYLAFLCRMKIGKK
ncbi:MAG: hypothetical protein AB1567_08490 [bacterium]